MSKPIVLSGIQPTSIPHLGNYLGAMRNWVALQETYRCFYTLVDLHAITLKQDPALLRRNTLESLAFFVASGLDPEHSTLFVQSHVPQHAELAWVMTCFAHMGELSRMTQFKDKSQKHNKDIPAGLFAYPTLMAADILLYKSVVVPVGQDQKQHLELARNLAIRFNNRFNKPVFVVPEPLMVKHGAKVQDLQNPTAKMSKSAENLKGVIFLNDSDKEIEKKIKGATTDSGSEIVSLEEASPGLRNLFEIHSVLSERSLENVFEEFRGKQYGHLKIATADLVVATVRPIREKAKELLTDESYLTSILKRGAMEARAQAQKTLNEVYDAVGFVAFPG